jgi:hypothetical protein
MPVNRFPLELHPTGVATERATKNYGHAFEDCLSQCAAPFYNSAIVVSIVDLNRFYSSNDSMPTVPTPPGLHLYSFFDF